MIRNLRISNWLESVQQELGPEPEQKHHQHQHQEQEQELLDRPAKRLRVSEPDTHTLVTLGNPSLTEATNIMSTGNKKRRSSQMETESSSSNGQMSCYVRSTCEGVDTNGAMPLALAPIASNIRFDPEQTLKLLPFSLSTPAKRHQSKSPTKSIAIFSILEKPIELVEATPAALPCDVQNLYYRIKKAVDYRQAIIPYTIKELLDYQLPPSCFSSAPTIEAQTPNATQASSADPIEARLIHTTLCRIKSAAVKSALCRRHGQAWNNLVHTPLLELLCRQTNNTEYEKPLEGVVADFEPMMAATIAGDSIPWLVGQGGGLACSISSTGGSSTGTPGTPGTPTPGSGLFINPNQVHSSSNSKKVDYALVLGLPNKSTLFRRIHALTNEIAIREESVPHFNQTTYQPVQYAPIAVSIETKAQFSPQDPMVQLGIWIAAWHKRMVYLRSQLSWGSDTRQQLISLPLIQVVGHQWQVFFACDTSEAITIHGPVSLGATNSLVALYALFTSLKAIKAWVELEFYEGLKRWLKVDED